MAGKPAMPVYPGDVKRNASLYLCPPAVRWVWFELRMMAWDCEDQGVLATGGRAWSLEQIAGLIVGDSAQNLSGLAELLERKVVLRNGNGAVYLPDVVEQVNVQKKRSRAGKSGGNPRLLGREVKHEVNHEVNHQDKQEVKPNEDESERLREWREPGGGELGGRGGYESSPPGAYRHPVYLGLRELTGNEHVEWVALEQGIQPPARVRATMAEIDRVTKKLGARGVAQVVEVLASVGGVSIAERRVRAAAELDALEKRARVSGIPATGESSGFDPVGVICGADD
jgi:hypothetical protein